MFEHCNNRMSTSDGPLAPGVVHWTRAQYYAKLFGTKYRRDSAWYVPNVQLTTPEVGSIWDISKQAYSNTWFILSVQDRQPRMPIGRRVVTRSHGTGHVLRGGSLTSAQVILLTPIEAILQIASIGDADDMVGRRLLPKGTPSISKQV
jgi:hypothetical protein